MYQKLNIIEKTNLANYVKVYMCQFDDLDVYILSHTDTCHLLSHQEIIGYDIYLAFKISTTQMLLFLSNNLHLESVDILYILRGGLNFPIEESCYAANIDVSGISFISSERSMNENTFDKIINNFSKMELADNGTLVIGDIIASGGTILNTINHIIKYYVEHNKRFRKLIIFTVGSKEALNIIKEIDLKIKKIWPDFIGISLIFYEGIFSTYINAGISGLNTPYIDFLYSGSYLAPEYRKKLFENPSAIFEKCVIYDGGERRFEPMKHQLMITQYWYKLKEVSVSINASAFINEKLGNQASSFHKWISYSGYGSLTSQEELQSIYEMEMLFLSNLNSDRFSYLCENRYLNLIATYNLK